MTTGHCDQKGCAYSATAKNQGGVNRLIGLHKRKAHGIIGKSVSAQWANKNPEGAKRAYTHRTQAVESTVSDVVTPNFCPNCGCNLRVITAALNLRRKS